MDVDTDAIPSTSAAAASQLHPLSVGEMREDVSAIGKC